MVVVVMGVSGAGKTTVGRLLAHQLGWPFFDADDFHPQANRDKMHRGEPLTDADRSPWLDALHDLLAGLAREHRDAVVACSALKQSYRDRLEAGLPDLRFVYQAKMALPVGEKWHADSELNRVELERDLDGAWKIVKGL